MPRPVYRREGMGTPLSGIAQQLGNLDHHAKAQLPYLMAAELMRNVD